MSRVFEIRGYELHLGGLLHPKPCHVHRPAVSWQNETPEHCDRDPGAPASEHQPDGDPGQVTQRNSEPLNEKVSLLEMFTALFWGTAKHVVRHLADYGFVGDRLCYVCVCLFGSGIVFSSLDALVALTRVFLCKPWPLAARRGAVRFGLFGDDALKFRSDDLAQVRSHDIQLVQV